MAFDSFVFLFRFLPLVLILYYLAPGRLKNVVLILGSLVFYAWGEPAAVIIILALTGLNFCLGKLIESGLDRPQSKVFLLLSVVINVLALLMAGYVDTFVPAGLFIYTLRALSYFVDIYRKETPSQRNIVSFFLYMTFFLQYPAGPVVSYKTQVKQLKVRQTDICLIQKGSVDFVRGLAKKVLLSESLYKIWETVSQQDMTTVSLLSAWLGILALSLGIYYDYSGICEMAEGLAALFGFSLSPNFDYPYTAVSVTDFWRRWYISLGDWFKEYVSSPVSKGSSKMWLRVLGIIPAWFFIGIWSGVGTNFICWGLWFAFFLILEQLFFGRILELLPHIVGRIYTLLVVMVSWVMFASNDFDFIKHFLMALLGINRGALSDQKGLFLLTENQILLVIAVVLCMPVWRNLIKRLQKSNSGYGVSVQRFLEKVSVVILLFLSLIYMTAA